MLLHKFQQIYGSAIHNLMKIRGNKWENGENGEWCQVNYFHET